MKNKKISSTKLIYYLPNQMITLLCRHIRNLIGDINGQINNKSKFLLPFLQFANNTLLALCLNKAELKNSTIGLLRMTFLSYTLIHLRYNASIFIDICLLTLTLHFNVLLYTDQYSLFNDWLIIAKVHFIPFVQTAIYR